MEGRRFVLIAPNLTKKARYLVERFAVDKFFVTKM